MAKIVVVQKDDRSFHLQKLTKKITWDLKYDFRGSVLELYKNGELVEGSEKEVDYFFRLPGVKKKDYIDLFSTDLNKSLFRYTFDLDTHYRTPESSKTIRMSLTKAFRLPHLQTLALAGIDPNKIKNLDMNLNETKPHKILQVPKYLLSIVGEPSLLYLDRRGLRDLTALEKVISANGIKQLFEIAKEEGCVILFSNLLSSIRELYTTFDYKDVYRLGKYLMRDVKLEQGVDNPITAANYLRDYTNMVRLTGGRYTKYSKSLKRDHDITMLNFRVVRDRIKKESFENAVLSESYKSLETFKRDYTIIVPPTVESLFEEGAALHHCVASYVSSIIEERCQIYFMRRTSNLDKPVLTIEVRNGTIRQVSGTSNRMANPMEVAFIRQWAKEKDIDLALYT